MKEERQEPKAVGEPPQVEAVEEPKVEAAEEPKIEAAEEPKIEAVEEPKIEAVEEPKIEAVEEPGTDVDREAASETADQRRRETDMDAGPPGGEEGDLEDGLELDRMEVKQAAEPEEEPQEEVEAEVVEPVVSGETEPARPNLLDLLAAYWIWIVAFLAGLSVVSAVLLFLLTPGAEERREVKLGKRVHVVNASLGGEHYVRFNLWGPFRDAKGLAALRRGMPRIKHELILSGGNPEVARAIEEKDLYFLEGHILEIVGNATGISVERLDLKGLSVFRYSDQAEVVGEE